MTENECAAPPYPAKTVANYFLSKGFNEGVDIDPMKLQKLVYIAHGWHLAISGRALLKEAPQAWKYGPVIQTLYHEFKRYGNTPILELAFDVEMCDDQLVTRTPMIDPDDAATLEVLEAVWESYKMSSGVRLSSLTHAPDTPWSAVWNEGGSQVQSAEIPDRLIEEHYEALIAQRSA